MRWTDQWATRGGVGSDLSNSGGVPEGCGPRRCCKSTFVCTTRGTRGAIWGCFWRCSLSASRRRWYVGWSDTWSASWEVCQGICVDHMVRSLLQHSVACCRHGWLSRRFRIAGSCCQVPPPEARGGFINGLIRASQDGSGLHVPAEADHCSSAEKCCGLTDGGQRLVFPHVGGARCSRRGCWGV